MGVPFHSRLCSSVECVEKIDRPLHKCANKRACNELIVIGYHIVYFVATVIFENDDSDDYIASVYGMHHSSMYSTMQCECESVCMNWVINLWKKGGTSDTEHVDLCDEQQCHAMIEQRNVTELGIILWKRLHSVGLAFQSSVANRSSHVQQITNNKMSWKWNCENMWKALF